VGIETVSDSEIRLLMYSPLSLRMGAGGDRWLSEVAPRLKRRGIHPTILATDFIVRGYRSTSTSWFVDKLVNAGIEYTETSSSRFFHEANLPVLTPESLRLLSKRMKSSDVTYFMNAFALQDLSVWLAKVMAGGVVAISAQHASLFQKRTMHNLYIRLITRNVLHAFDAFHVLNVEDYLQYRRWGLNRVAMIPNGVDTGYFTPSREKHEDGFIALFVGRLDYQKGIDTLIQAVKHLEDNTDTDSSGITFKVCGTGPMREMVERFADKRDYVHYLGYVPEDELLSLYRSANLFLMPSRRETFGLAALEAMASGIPVIATDIPGPRSFVKNDFGCLIPASDSSALAEATHRFYRLFTEDKEKWKVMAGKARTVSVSEYDWEQVTDKLSHMIREVAGKTHK